LQTGRSEAFWIARYKTFDGQYFGSRGFPIVTIQRILGHKQLTTTERYIRGLEPVKPALEILSNRDLRPKVPTTIQISQKQKSEVT
jgi:integrase